METERGQYPVPVPQTQVSNIDPSLPGASQGTAPFPPGTNPADLKTPATLHSPPPNHPNQDQYPPVTPWTNGGYRPQNGYAGHYAFPPNQPPPPISYAPFPPTSGAPFYPEQREANDPKRSRACEACRGLKVRCEPDPVGGSCKRCQKANRSCVISPPSRKRQKKGDPRIAELERKIEEIQRGQSLSSTNEASYHSNNDKSHFESRPSVYPANDGRTPFEAPMYPGQKGRFSEYQQDEPMDLVANAASAAPLVEEVLPKTVLQMALEAYNQRYPSALAPRTDYRTNAGSGGFANQHPLNAAIEHELFTHYTVDMAPIIPILVFPYGAKPDDIRTNHPVLFLAIMSVASSKYPSLHSSLIKEIMSTLANRIVVNGEKSLELVQALQVVTIWYWPETNGVSNYYQLVHMAATMAIDLGLNRKPDLQRQPITMMPGAKPSTIDTKTLECRRAWLGCYLLCSSIGMGTRRPMPIRSNTYLEDCIAELQNSGITNDTDGMLCYLVRLQLLADDLSIQILPSENAGISEVKVRNAHKAFEKQLGAWRAESTEATGQSFLTLHYNIVGLYMHELVIQHDSSAESPKAPRVRGKSQAPPSQLDCLHTALNFTSGIIESFLNFNTHHIRALPTFQFAQIAHAIGALIKVYYVGKQDPDFSREGLLTAEMVQAYHERLIALLQSALVDSNSMPTLTFLMVIQTFLNLFLEMKDMDMELVRERYHGVPSFAQAQIIGLAEPQPMPQRQRVKYEREIPEGALHLLSEAAVGSSSASGYGLSSTEKAGAANPQDGPESEEMEAERHGIDFCGVMQTMWLGHR